MDLSDTQSCAAREISGLSHHSSPRQAMLAFCAHVFSEPVKFHGQFGRTESLYSFYIFTQGRVRRFNYGHRFAEFIKKNELGQVMTSPPVTNKAFHPDHTNTIFIWIPDREALKEFWHKEKVGSYAH